MGGRSTSLRVGALAGWLLALGVGAAAAGQRGGRTVVVLLFDGFAPSMVAAYPTPALDRMRRVRAIDVHPTVAYLLGIAPGNPVDGEVAAALVADLYAEGSDE